MTYKFLTFILLMFSCKSPVKEDSTYQPPINEPRYEHVGPLPEGNSGIAARYPGDVGIGSDSAVILADDFESHSSVADLTTSKWNEAYHAPNLRIATGPGNFFSGSKGLEFKVPQTEDEVSNTVVKYVSPVRDSLFLRYYGKFDTLFDVHGSSHNGSTMSSSYWDGPGSGPGVRADGFNKFFVSYEAGRFETGIANPGKLNIYIYHPGQRDIWGDHFYPTGRILPFDQMLGDFGPQFVARPDVIPVPGRWYSYELMVKANTPGKPDGRIAMWLDGNLIADFPNLRIRETTTLKIDRLTIDLHVNGKSLGEARKWVDNVVAAKSYIGPIQ